MCCVEIVTPLAVFINHLLSTAMAMFQINGKLLMIAIVSTEGNRTKYLDGSKRLLMDRKQLILNCATATFYQELAASQIVRNWRNTGGELRYKARRNLM